MNARLDLTLTDRAPAYRQIVDQIRLLLQTGALPKGHTLPGVRPLAAQLGVHHNTIAEAYRTLAAEGLLELSRGRRAAVVGARAPVPVPMEERSALRGRLRALVAELRTKGIPTRVILKDVEQVLGSKPL